jgi:hypothetical protein
MAGAGALMGTPVSVGIVSQTPELDFRQKDKSTKTI